MSTLVDQARKFLDEMSYFHDTEVAQLKALTRQLADRVQELEGKPESAGWQCRAKSMDPDDADDPWSRWKEVSPACLDAWRRRVERDPDYYELREVFASPPSSVQPEKERRPIAEHELRGQIESYAPQSDDEEIGFRDGWRSSERFHGISPPPSMVGREDTTHE